MKDSKVEKLFKISSALLAVLIVLITCANRKYNKYIKELNAPHDTIYVEIQPHDTIYVEIQPHDTVYIPAPKPKYNCYEMKGVHSGIAQSGRKTRKEDGWHYYISVRKLEDATLYEFEVGEHDYVVICKGDTIKSPK